MTCEIEKTARGQFKLILKLYWPILYHIIYGIEKVTPYVLPVIKKLVPYHYLHPFILSHKNEQ